MEDTTPPEELLHLDAAAKSDLRTAASWAQFIAFSLAVMLGLVTFAILFFGLVVKFSTSFSRGRYPALEGLHGVTFFAFAFILILLGSASVFFLFRFSSRTTGGIRGRDNDQLVAAFLALRNFLMITGGAALVMAVLKLFRIFI